MIDILVVATLVILAAVVIVWISGPHVRVHTERPKHELLERIRRFEAAHPRREVIDPHRDPTIPMGYPSPKASERAT